MSYQPFCRECGAGFPPRNGEGICKDWKNCLAKQMLGNFSVKTLSKVLEQAEIIETQGVNSNL